MPGGMGTNLRPRGLISWTGRLLASSMAPVAGSGHLILRLPSHGRRVERVSDVWESQGQCLTQVLFKVWECVLLVSATFLWGSPLVPHRVAQL
jgi:hypothetical protein